MAAPRIAVIAGGSASGKSTVSRALADQLGERCALLLHDRYYRPPDPALDPSRVNYDHPDSLETELLVAHVEALRRGESVAVPRYDFARHAREPATDPVHPTEIILVEGILVLAVAELRAVADLTVFVDAPSDIRLARRLLRDVSTRGRDPIGVVGQYLATVRPMHEQFVEPSREHADLILDGTAPVDTLVGQVLGRLGPRR